METTSKATIILDLSSLGLPITSMEELARVSETVLDGGRKRQFVDGTRVPWLGDEQNVVIAYLEKLHLPDGASVKDRLWAVPALRRAVGFRLVVSEDRFFFARSPFLDLLEQARCDGVSDPGEYRFYSPHQIALDRATEIEASAEEGWWRAIGDGRILVFAQSAHQVELVMPEAALTMLRTPRPVRRRRSFDFLIRVDLDFVLAPRPALRARRGSSSLDDEDEPFVQEAMSWLRAGEVKNPTRAASMLGKKYGEKLPGGSTLESRETRLRKKVNALWRQEGS